MEKEDKGESFLFHKRFFFPLSLFLLVHPEYLMRCNENAKTSARDSSLEERRSSSFGGSIVSDDVVMDWSLCERRFSELLEAFEQLFLA